jgi:uncharacterized repeat protein (TIGR02543 family)
MDVLSFGASATTGNWGHAKEITVNNFFSISSADAGLYRFVLLDNQANLLDYTVTITEVPLYTELDFSQIIVNNAAVTGTLSGARFVTVWGDNCNMAAGHSFYAEAGKTYQITIKYQADRWVYMWTSYYILTGGTLTGILNNDIFQDGRIANHHSTKELVVSGSFTSNETGLFRILLADQHYNISRYSIRIVEAHHDCEWSNEKIVTKNPTCEEEGRMAYVCSICGEENDAEAISMLSDDCIFTVTFNSQGGSTVPSAAVEHGGKITEPTPPTQTNHIFGGWYKESICVNAWNFATDVITANITLFAKWTANIPKYTVTITPPTNGTITVLNDDMPVTSGMQLDSATMLTLQATPHAGHRFVQWWDNDTNSNRQFVLRNHTTKSATFEPTSTNIIEAVSESDLKVYPNPFTNILHITEAEGYTLRIMTQNGVLVHTQRISSNLEALKLQYFSAGIYVLQLIKNGKIKTIRIVKL